MAKSYYALRGVEHPDPQQATVSACMLSLLQQRNQPILGFGFGFGFGFGCGCGELPHALRAAGCNQIAGTDVHAVAVIHRRTLAIDLLDTGRTAGIGPPKKAVKRLLLAVYKANRQFWNKVTSSSYHRPSPVVYSYEIKLLARSR